MDNTILINDDGTGEFSGFEFAQMTSAAEAKLSKFTRGESYDLAEVFAAQIEIQIDANGRGTLQLVGEG